MGASLAEELGAAIDGVELPSGDDVVDTGAVVDTGNVDTAADTGAARDEHGRFAPKDTKPAEADPDAPAPAEPTAVDPNAPAIDPAIQAETRSAAIPPATWSASAKAIYATLPEVARKEIAKREADYSRGIQAHAEKAKIADTLMREIQPYEAMLRSEGSTPDRAIASLLRSAYVLRTASPQQKTELIMQIAQQYGADLSQLQGQRQPAEGQQDLSQVQQMVQQLVAPHLQRIQSWEQQQTQAQQAQSMQMEQEISSQIETFQSATNEDGTPKHLYFENVRPLMSAYFANGQAKDLEQAYEMACWANPEVRAALLADQQRAAEAQRLEEAKRKATGARNASFGVTGQGGVGISGATQSSLRDELASQLDAAMGGARV